MGDAVNKIRLPLVEPDFLDHQKEIKRQPHKDQAENGNTNNNGAPAPRACQERNPENH